MKMRFRTGHAAAFVLCGLLLFGCGGDGPSSPRAGDPGAGDALSGGDLTVFTPTLQGFSTPSPVTSDLGLHLEGDLLAEVNRVAGDGLYGGLGPTYNSTACASCHIADGRSTSDLWRYGGSGPASSNFLLRISTANGDPVPGYGTVLHDQAIFGFVPEVRIGANYTMEKGRFADGAEYELARPHYTFSEWYTGAPPPDMVFSTRIPLRQVGMGLMRAVSDETIEALAAAQETPLSGRPHYTVDERGNPGIGRFGHKAQNVNMDTERTFLSDVGLTSPHFLDEPIAEQGVEWAHAESDAPDISLEEADAVEFYFFTLGVPARRDLDDPVVRRGETVFREAGCDGCHVSNIETGADLVRTLGGTPVPELANQTIHSYSDFLLHDMGPDLADAYRQGDAEGYEWRTPPLWGIGLQSVINGNTFFLHDGRARNLMEAILWHGGEAEESREHVRSLPKGDRDALVRFLQSL